MRGVTSFLLVLLLSLKLLSLSSSSFAKDVADAEDFVFGDIFKHEQEIREASLKEKLQKMRKDAEILREKAKSSPLFQVCLKKNALLVDLDTEKVFYVPVETYVYLYSAAPQTGEAYYFVHDPKNEYDRRFKVSAHDFETLNDIRILSPWQTAFKEVKSPFPEENEFLFLRNTFYGGFLQSKRSGVAGKKDFLAESFQLEDALSFHNENFIDFGLLASYVKDIWAHKDRAYIKQAWYLGPLIETGLGSYADHHVYLQLVAQYAFKSSLIQNNETVLVKRTWTSKSYRIRSQLRFQPLESLSNLSFGGGLSFEWYQLHRADRDEMSRETSFLVFMAYQWEKKI